MSKAPDTTEMEQDPETLLHAPEWPTMEPMNVDDIQLERLAEQQPDERQKKTLTALLNIQ